MEEEGSCSWDSKSLEERCCILKQRAEALEQKLDILEGETIQTPVSKLAKFKAREKSGYPDSSSNSRENAALEYLVSIGRDRLQEKQSSRDDRSFHRFDDSSRYESWKNLSRKYSSNKSPERQKRKRSISSKRSTSSSRRRKSRSSSPRKSSHHSRSHRRTKSRTRSRSKSRHRSRSSRRSQGDSRKATPPSDRLNSTLFEISPEPLKRSFDSETFLEHSQEQLSPFLNERVRKLEEYFEGKNPNLTEKELVDLKFPLFESGIENQKFERSVASYSSSITENNNFKVNDGNFGNQEFEGTGKLCKYYLCGYCKLGARCTFSHKCQPLVKKKVELCLYYAGDGCSKGELCQRLHKQFPCKDFHKTRSCTLGPKRCKFSHDSLNTELENALNRFILFNPTVKRKTTNDQPYRNTPLSQKHVDLDIPKNDATNFVNSAFCNQSPQFSSFHAGNDPRPKYANQFSAPSEAYQKSYVVDSQFSEGPPNFSLGVRQQHPNDSCQSLQSGTSPSSIEVPWNTTRSKSYEPTIFSANDDNANGVEWYDPLRFPLPANDREKVTPQWKTEPEAKFSPPMEVSTVKNEVLPSPRFEELSGQMFPVKRSPEFFTPTTQCSGVGSHQNSSSSSSYRCVAIPFEKQCSLKDPRIENFNNDSSIYRGLLTCKVSLPSLPGIQTCATEISCNYIIPWRTLRPLTLQPIESVSDSYSTERLMSKQTLSLSGAGLVEKPEIKLEIQKEIQSLCQLNFKQVAPKEEPEDPEQRRISGSLSIKELFCMADPTASPFV